MLTSLASGLASFCGFRFLLGAGEAANWPAATKAVSEWFPRRERGLAVALFDSGSSIGAAIAPALVLFLIGHFGDWRWAFVITGCLGFLWLVAWRRFYHPPETHPYVSEAERRMILEDRAAEQANEAAPADGCASPELRAAPVPAPDLGHHREPRPHRSRLVHDRRLVRDLPLGEGLRSRADRGRLLGALPGRRPRQLLGRRLVRRAHHARVVGGARAAARHRGGGSGRAGPHPRGLQLLAGPASWPASPSPPSPTRCCPRTRSPCPPISSRAARWRRSRAWPERAPASAPSARPSSSASWPTASPSPPSWWCRASSPSWPALLVLALVRNTPESGQGLVKVI